MSVTRIIALVLAGASLAGCSGGDVPPSPAGAATSPATSAASSAPAPAASGPSPGGSASSAPGGAGGVGASAARTSGVFSAPYDAALRGPDRAAAGRARVRLVNVGRQPDTYRISVAPAGAATVTPATAELAPGAAVVLVLRLRADASVRVFSTGRDAEVADLPISLG